MNLKKNYKVVSQNYLTYLDKTIMWIHWGYRLPFPQKFTVLSLKLSSVVQ